MTRKQEVISNPFFPIKVEEIKTVDSGILVPRKAIFNADTGKVISVTGLDYQVVENGRWVEQFEDYLKDSDVKFIRSNAMTNRTGSQFSARYRFPDIRANFGERQTNFGTVPDDVELAINLWNSYDGSSTAGFDVGGFRLICLNGLRVFEQLYKWSRKHMGEEEIVNQMLISFDTVKKLFIEKLVPSWQAMRDADFDNTIAFNLVQKLELSKLYRKKLGLMWYQKKQLNQLNTMWDFYNLITAFTTHYVEGRNMKLAQQIGANASRQLMQIEG